jgi:SAM-dependent methyltransferase
MHDTAKSNGRLFFDTYPPKSDGLKVVDIGAQNVSGSLKSFIRPTDNYIGVDFVEAPGIDVVLEDPYKLPFDDESIDVVVSSSCLEHSEFFWETFIETLRVLKPAGLLYLNVPSNGAFHRYPVDCWRFYPDSGRALERWARRKGLSPAMLESYVGAQRLDGWNDLVAVFVKDAANAGLYPNRMQDRISDFTNGLVLGSDEFRRYSYYPEDYTMGTARRYGVRALNLVRTVKRKIA